ncbi:MAG: hypothetical protein AAF597_18665, partial [Bacteroidota bacterium]
MASVSEKPAGTEIRGEILAAAQRVQAQNNAGRQITALIINDTAYVTLIQTVDGFPDTSVLVMDRADYVAWEKSGNLKEMLLKQPKAAELQALVTEAGKLEENNSVQDRPSEQGPSANPDNQIADNVENQTTDTPDIQTTESPDSQTANTPDIQTTENPDNQPAENLDNQTPDNTDIQVTDNPDSTTTFKATPRSPWSIGLETTVSRLGQALQNGGGEQTSGELLPFYQAYVRPLEAVSADLLLGYRTKSNWTLRSGIGYSRLNTVAGTSSVSVNDSTRAEGIVRIDITAPGDTSFVTGIVPTTQTTTRTQEYFNHLTLLDIPILLGREFNFGKLSFQVEAGPSFNVQTRASA